MKNIEYEYDIFISHAVEDKIPIANELYRLLEKKNLKVWYSGSELSVGDRLTGSIHSSLDKCRFGVVIISPTYLSKIWALNEFFFLLMREKNGEKVILPVLYDITPEELAFRSPLMADIFAVRANKGLDHVADILFREVQKENSVQTTCRVTSAPLQLSKKTAVFTLAFFLLATIASQLVIHYFLAMPGNNTIEQRISSANGQNNASFSPTIFFDNEQLAAQAGIELVVPNMESLPRITLRIIPPEAAEGCAHPQPSLTMDRENKPTAKTVSYWRREDKLVKQIDNPYVNYGDKVSVTYATLIFASSEQNLGPMVITVAFQPAGATASGIMPKRATGGVSKATFWNLVRDH